MDQSSIPRGLTSADGRGITHWSHQPHWLGKSDTPELKHEFVCETQKKTLLTAKPWIQGCPFCTGQPEVQSYPGSTAGFILKGM